MDESALRCDETSANYSGRRPRVKRTEKTYRSVLMQSRIEIIRLIVGAASAIDRADLRENLQIQADYFENSFLSFAGIGLALPATGYILFQ